MQSDIVTVVGLLVLVLLIAIGARAYRKRLKVRAKVPGASFEFEGEDSEPSGSRPEQLQEGAEKSSQEMVGASGGKQTQKNTKGSRQKMM
ncbi:hypothetical protein MYX75_04810 [Acidobacteria bacterium AH-259-A15]|nr:hypothetical protein [Acidobacteria bacterium AH-259-A15]